MENIVYSLSDLLIEADENMEDIEYNENTPNNYLLDDNISEIFLIVINYPNITLGDPEYLKSIIINKLNSNINIDDNIYPYENRLIYSIIYYLETYESDQQSKLIFEELTEYIESETDKYGIDKLINIFNYIPCEYWLCEDYEVKLDEVIVETEEYIEDYNDDYIHSLITNCNNSEYDDKYFWILIKQLHVWNIKNEINSDNFHKIMCNLKINQTQREILSGIL